jgi:hypothetical protein
VQMRPQPRDNIARVDWRISCPLTLHARCKVRSDRGPSRGGATLCVDRRSKDPVDKSCTTMHLERSQVCAQVHPLRLTLLLINVSDPEERRGALAECPTNARHKEVWNERGVEAARSKDDQFCVCERLEGRLRCGGARWKQLDT